MLKTNKLILSILSLFLSLLFVNDIFADTCGCSGNDRYCYYYTSCCPVTDPCECDFTGGPIHCGTGEEG